MSFQEMYISSQNLGYLMTKIYLVVGIVLAVIFVSLAIFFLFRKKKYTERVIGTVTNIPNCNSNGCSELIVDYKYNDKNLNVDFIKPHPDLGLNYSQGQTIPIYVNPQTEKASLHEDLGSKSLSIFLIVLAVIILGISIFMFWIVRKNNMAAAVTGPVSLFRFI